MPMLPLVTELLDSPPDGNGGGFGIAQTAGVLEHIRSTNRVCVHQIRMLFLILPTRPKLPPVLRGVVFLRMWSASFS